MPEYRTADEYIADVQKEIKWKRAKYIATREIADHITDQCNAYCQNGLDSENAIRQTCIELGDASMIGAELNRLHKPKTNWLLLILTSIVIAIGALADFSFSSEGITKNIAVLCIGCGIVALLYWTDYTIMLRFPKIIYFGLLSITVVVLIYDARNGFALISYSYSFYLLLLFPLIQVAVALQLRNKKSSVGLLILSVYLFIPLLLSALISSPPAMIYLIVSDIVIAICVIKNKWFTISGVEIFGIICVVAILVIGLLYTNMWTNMWGHFFTTNGDYVSALTKHELFNIPILGSAEQPEVYNSISEYALARLAFRYGWVVFVASGVLFSIILYLLFRVSIKQVSYFGKLISGMVFILFSLQLTLAFLGNLGLINATYIMPLPFVASGGIFTLYNLLLIGVMMSVSRYEDIAKDWIKLKARKCTREEKE
ncbi:MAG: hypothetical protein GX051_07690 [Clostridiales bacterium]|nr:hypothetical protein [Clostridiales bacterium]